MKQKLLSLLMGVALTLVFTAPALAQGPFGDDGRVVFGANYTLESGQSLNGDLVVFGGNVTTEADSTVDGSLAVFGGNVTMNGTVEGDLAAIGGNVTITGKVEGDIASLGGNVVVSESAEVDGDIASFGGRVDIAEGASVDGDVKDGRDARGDRHGDDQRPSAPTPPIPPQPDFSGHDWDGWNNDGYSFFGTVGRIIGDILWTMAMLFVLGLISWLVAAFMPEQVLNVRRTISDSTALSFGLGFITMVVAIVVGVVLIITICLAFIPILAYIFLAIAALFGWIVIGHMLGERLLEATGRRDPGLVMSSVVGVIVLTLLTNLPVIGSIPCIGWIFGFIAWLIGTALMLTGLGAVLLTRFGFREFPAAPGYTAPPSAPPSGGAGTYTPNRPRWTDPAPDVSDEDPIASEEELRAKIKEALAEADELKYAPKPQPAPEPEPAPEEPEPEAEPDSPADDAPETPADDEPGDAPKNEA
ncbi:MAG: hypothetical protein Kow0031_33670 [Anaerolineae bacterium]